MKQKRPDFFIANMIPTCVNEDRAAAMAVNRKTLTPYAMLPNYRNYWKEAGFVEEMEGVEAALERETVTVSTLSHRPVAFRYHTVW